MMTIYRDLGFFLATLIQYYFILQKGVIYEYETLIILGMTVFYAIAVWYTNKKIKEINNVAILR